MTTEETISEKKKKRESFWTLIGLFAISMICAAYVINFRLKMKQYQITPQEQEEVLKQEKEFDKTQTSPGKKHPAQ